MEATLADDVAEGIGTGVAIIRGVGHFAHTNAVKNDPDYAREHKFERSTEWGWSHGFTGMDMNKVKTTFTDLVNDVFRLRGFGCAI
jgi:hypothetical protein